MFMHIGKGQIVFTREIIGIFNYDLNENRGNREFINASGLEADENDRKDQPKSFIVNDKAVYCSPIAPQTLARRGCGE